MSRKRKEWSEIQKDAIAEVIVRALQILARKTVISLRRGEMPTLDALSYRYPLGKAYAEAVANRVWGPSTSAKS